jgi:leucyl-tRNA synthetase
LWQQLGYSNSIHQQSWLSHDPEALVLDEITLVIQIMGKTRGTIQVSANSSKEELEKAALESEVAQKHLAGKEIKKVIVVPGKLVNFVVA